MTEDKQPTMDDLFDTIFESVVKFNKVLGLPTEPKEPSTLDKIRCYAWHIWNFVATVLFSVVYVLCVLLLTPFLAVVYGAYRAFADIRFRLSDRFN
jgi:hypothetical protein